MALPTASRVNWSQIQLKNKVPTLASRPLRWSRVARWFRLPGCIQPDPSQDGVFESTFANDSWLLSPVQADFGQVLRRPIETAASIGPC
jgi:hypothetical protein